jgi:hypothetical protein
MFEILVFVSSFRRTYLISLRRQCGRIRVHYLVDNWWTDFEFASP